MEDRESATIFAHIPRQLSLTVSPSRLECYSDAKLSRSPVGRILYSYEGTASGPRLISISMAPAQVEIWQYTSRFKYLLLTQHGQIFGFDNLLRGLRATNQISSGRGSGQADSEWNV